jgi:protein-disulfide isomerase
MRKLDEMILDRLMRKEAARQGIPVDQLMTKAFEGKDVRVTDAEVTKYIDDNRSTFPKNLGEAELVSRVRTHLEDTKESEIRNRFLNQLRSQGQVTILLKEPQMIRIPVSADTGAVRGAPDARITIVAFTDFNCSYCKQASATLKQVLADYKDRVKLVFRDYPAEPDGRKAHEAARCAGAQGKFWEYHDVLFERTPKLGVDDLKAYAKEIQLDEAAFGQCLESERYRAAVNSDIGEGRKFGIRGTPTFLINGLPLVGSHAPATFKRMIEGELAATK